MSGTIGRLAVIALAGLLAAAGLVACGPGAGRTAAGVVIAVDGSGGSIRAFTLRTTDGEIVAFTIGTLEIEGAAFPASHLAEHAVTLVPISVAYREDGESRVVYRMADAPWAAPSG